MYNTTNAIPFHIEMLFDNLATILADKLCAGRGETIENQQKRSAKRRVGGNEDNRTGPTGDGGGGTRKRLASVGPPVVLFVYKFGIRVLAGKTLRRTRRTQPS